MDIYNPLCTMSFSKVKQNSKIVNAEHVSCFFGTSWSTNFQGFQKRSYKHIMYNGKNTQSLLSQ